MQIKTKVSKLGGVRCVNLSTADVPVGAEVTLVIPDEAEPAKPILWRGSLCDFTEDYFGPRSGMFPDCKQCGEELMAYVSGKTAYAVWCDKCRVGWCCGPLPDDFEYIAQNCSKCAHYSALRHEEPCRSCGRINFKHALSFR